MTRLTAPPGTRLSVALPGGSIDYRLRRSPRSRRLRVTIDPEHGVVVSVPPSTRRGWARPEPLVDQFLREREAWLRRHLGRQAAQRAALASRGGLAEGGVVRFRGELHRLRITRGARGRSSVEREGGADGDELVVRVAEGDRRPIADVLVAWFRERATTAIDREVQRHAQALGVAPTRVSLRDPRSRWGSASREGRLSFSWRLVLAPPEALETVVIHELAHLRVFGHSPAFWSLVASRRPDHREWRRWLREHSLELHAALDAPA
jgi:predicted metal-dependent hydrolase